MARKLAPIKRPDQHPARLLREASPVERVLMLQQRVGNAATQHLLGDAGAQREQITSLQQRTEAHGGQPLDGTTRQMMETHLGDDFGDVRIHTDSYSAQLADQAQAQAFTSGRHIVFGANQYAPQTADGSQLLAHELAHVVQQRSAAPEPRWSTAGEISERHADQMAGSYGINAPQPASVPAIQRQEAPFLRRLNNPAIVAEMKQRVAMLKSHYRWKMFGLSGFDRALALSHIREYVRMGRDEAAKGRGDPSYYVDAYLFLMTTTTYDRGLVATKLSLIWDAWLEAAEPAEIKQIHSLLQSVNSFFTDYKYIEDPDEPSFASEVVGPMLALATDDIIDTELINILRKSRHKPDGDVLKAIAIHVTRRVADSLTLGGATAAWQAVEKYWSEHPDDDPVVNLFMAYNAGMEAALEAAASSVLPINEIKIMAGTTIDEKTGKPRESTAWEKIGAFFTAVVKVISLGKLGKTAKNRFTRKQAADISPTASQSAIQPKQVQAPQETPTVAATSRPTAETETPKPTAKPAEIPAPSKVSAPADTPKAPAVQAAPMKTPDAALALETTPARKQGRSKKSETVREPKPKTERKPRQSGMQAKKQSTPKTLKAGTEAKKKSSGKPAAPKAKTRRAADQSTNYASMSLTQLKKRVMIDEVARETLLARFENMPIKKLKRYTDSPNFKVEAGLAWEKRRSLDLDPDEGLIRQVSGNPHVNKKVIDKLDKGIADERQVTNIDRDAALAPKGDYRAEGRDKPYSAEEIGRDVKGGTVGAATTDIEGFDQIVVGKSPEARLPHEKDGTPGPVKSEHPHPGTHGHAEEEMANKYIAIFEKAEQDGRLRRDDLKGKTVFMRVEQEVCMACRQKLKERPPDAKEIGDGVLKQFSERYPELTIEITNRESSEVLRIRNGKDITED